MSARSRASGFTLVEVLVALAIVTLAMAALISTLTSAADNTSYLRDKSFAQWIALNRIAEVRLQPNKPDEGTTKGEVVFAGSRWLWEQEVRNLEIPGMRSLEVRVRPADAPGSDDRSWYITVFGAFGDAVLPPRGDLPTWEHSQSGPGSGQVSPGEDGEGENAQKPGRRGSHVGEQEEPRRERRPSLRQRLGT